MKKQVLISMIAMISFATMAFSFSEQENPNPIPTEWCFEITWDDSNCNCGPLVKQTLAWALYKWNGTNWGNPIAGEASVIISTLSPYSYDACGTVSVPSAANGYKYCYKVQYEDANGVCCYAEGCTIGNSPIDSDYTFELILE